MNRLVQLLCAGAVAALLSGCATYEYGYASPYYGYSQPYYGYAYPYAYGPYYYDYGPYYYGYGPGYYGAPFVGFDFRYHDRGDWHAGSHGGDRGHSAHGSRRTQQGAVRPAPARQQNQVAPASRSPRIAPTPPARRDTNQAARARAPQTAELRADQR
jgi:hypothetical protein